MAKGTRKVILYVFIVTLPLILALIFGHSNQNFLWNTGRGFALMGITILALQALLAGRFKWITRNFGFDIVIRYHRNISIFAVFLLLFHPLLLMAGGAGWRLIFGGNLYIWLGKTALFLVLLNVLISVYQNKINLKFERWRVSHDVLSSLLIVLTFSHSWYVGTDLRLVPLRILWILLFSAAVWAFIYHRFIRPWILARNPYEVTEVKEEATKVWTVKLSPPKGKNIFDYTPGQFQFIKFLRGRGLPEEEHHWTISSSPSQKKYLSSTIKALGDFTSTMGETQPGDKAVVHAPFGRFSYLFHPEEKDLVFIAGGIGITPLMSMLRYMRDQKEKRPVTLLYGNPNQDSIVFREELGEIEKGENPSLKVVHVLSNPEEDWTGEKGYIDPEKIKKYCGDNLSQKGFYVVGPPMLIEKSIQNLRDMGVKDKQIHMEIFSFLD
jgi:predicted ferric reductase